MHLFKTVMTFYFNQKVSLVEKWTNDMLPNVETDFMFYFFY